MNYHTYVTAAVALSMVIALAIFLAHQDLKERYQAFRERYQKDARPIDEILTSISQLECEVPSDSSLRVYLYDSRDLAYRLQSLLSEILRLENRYEVSYEPMADYSESIRQDVCTLLSGVIDDIETHKTCPGEVDAYNVNRALAETKELLKDLQLSKVAFQYCIFSGPDTNLFTAKDLNDVIDSIRSCPAKYGAV